MVVGKRSYLNLGSFNGYLGKRDRYYCTMVHLNLATTAESQASEAMIPTILGETLTPENVMATIVPHLRSL